MTSKSESDAWIASRQVPKQDPVPRQIHWDAPKSRGKQSSPPPKVKNPHPPPTAAIGTEVQLRGIRIRVLHAYVALRYTTMDAADGAPGFTRSSAIPHLLLRRNDAACQYELFGGACPPGWTLQEALMKHLRDQLCARFALDSLERFLIAALQKRNFARLVGGGTLYAPVINAQGFQSYVAYVVIDVPNGNVLPLIARSNHALQPFDGTYAFANMSETHRDLLASLLRLRMQVFRPPYCLPDDPPPAKK